MLLYLWHIAEVVWKIHFKESNWHPKMLKEILNISHIKQNQRNNSFQYWNLLISCREHLL